MGLENRTALVMIEDPALAREVQGALKPLLKTVVGVERLADAVHKIEQQDFDCIVYRTAQSSLKDPKGCFQWTLTRKSAPKTPPYWLVLGKDVEPEDIIVKHPNVKFLEKRDDMPGLVRMLEGLFYSQGKDRPAVDVNFLNPIVSAVVNVLQTMARLELARGTPFIKGRGQTPMRGDITGIVSMSSDRFTGSLAISFEEKLALKIYANMLGAPVPAINDEVKDAVMELTNIILGHAKRDLNAMGHTIAPAIPTVVTGKGHEVNHAVTGTCLSIPFKAPEGALNVECILTFKD